MPASWSAAIGGTGRVAMPPDAQIVVSFQSLYVLDNNRDTVRRIVRFLSEQDYIGGISSTTGLERCQARCR